MSYWCHHGYLSLDFETITEGLTKEVMELHCGKCSVFGAWPILDVGYLGGLSTLTVLFSISLLSKKGLVMFYFYIVVLQKNTSYTAALLADPFMFSSVVFPSLFNPFAFILPSLFSPLWFSLCYQSEFLRGGEGGGAGQLVQSWIAGCFQAAMTGSDRQPL